MAAYPLQQQALHLQRQHSSKPATTPIHHQTSHGNPQPDGVPAASIRLGAPTDAHGLRALIRTLSSASSATAAEAAAVHAHAAKLGLDRERTVRNGLITLYLARGGRAAAASLFHGFPGGRDVVSWTAMVTGHARRGLAAEAVALFLEMLDDGDGDSSGGSGLAVDAVAAASGFAACAELGDLAVAGEAHRRVTAAGVTLDAIAWNALVDMYAKCGDLATARRWFEAMPTASKSRTVVSWNTMISALSRAGEHGEALALFREMQRAGTAAGTPPPDDATLVAVLGACAKLGAFGTGRWVHAYIMRKQRHRELADGGGVAVGNALIDMYAKCGAVEDAVAVFERMAPRRDACTYASMITGLAAHGRAGDALEVFDAMRRAGGGVRPNGVALLGVLSACCHAGRVDEGLRHLRDMERRRYAGVAPGVEHYGCAVDMLGRAGRLDEAEALVAAMPVTPDALVWGSLLAACRAAGDVERAERVMRRVGEGDGDSGDYVLMSNMYASRGRHGMAVRVRKKMRKRNVRKDPGCSVIEIDGVAHEFRAVPANSVTRSLDAE
ncbi:unnamed protein product [Urochloa decumbens]|uniref:Pentatricopeptide repeat-containing protein n=1 Tax=Urochloa decumbens TaxID=240449 RepID=A0ABC9DBN7_9POAL